MKNILFTLLILISSLATLSAQDAPTAYIVEDGYDFWHKQPGDTAYVFADVAYIRDYPSTRGRLLDSLTQETEVIIKSESYNNSFARGFEAPWYKVSYIKDGKRKEGFIWAGLLALGRTVNNTGNVFSFGFLKREKETDYNFPSYLLEVKCFDENNNLKSRNHYPAELNEQRYSEYKLLPNMGLAGLENIFRIGFLAESCGVPTIHYYFSWNGQEIIPMFDRQRVSDAGVFYYEETILFPSEHKLDANLILKDIEEGEVIDDTAVDLEYKKTRKREKFIWDGKYARQLLEMKAID